MHDSPAVTARVIVGNEADRPGRAWRLLGPWSTTAIAAPLVGMGILGWYLTAKQARDMDGMVTGLGQIGTHMANPMGPAAFMGMWLWMMVAMMLPAVAPVVLAHRMIVQARRESFLVTVAFVAGYLLAWTVAGFIPLLAFLMFRRLPMEAADSAWVHVLAGSVLLGAGVYQFTPWKGQCLRHCRSPLGFVLSHDYGSGIAGACRAGLSHGTYCVGCCWALMSLLVVVGLMNLVWMAAIAIILLAEKNSRYGVALVRIAGVTLAFLGVAVAGVPPLLTAIAG